MLLFRKNPSLPYDASGSPTNSARLGRFLAWLIVAQFCSFRRNAFSSLSIGALLALACLLAAPASAHAQNTYTVTTLADQNDTSPDCTSGTGSTCSLRDAIALANTESGDTIQFASGVTGVIYLSPFSGYGYFIIKSPMSIVGPGANLLTVSEGGYYGIVEISPSLTSGTVSISGLTLTETQGNVIANDSTADLAINGCTIAGLYNQTTGIYNYSGALSVMNSTIYGNFGDGGILSEGPVTVINSTITGNSGDLGGGIVAYGNVTVIDSTITGNSASSDGGIFVGPNGTVTLTNSIVAGNTTKGVLDSGDCSACNSQSSNNYVGGNPELGSLSSESAVVVTVR